MTARPSIQTAFVGQTGALTPPWAAYIDALEARLAELEAGGGVASSSLPVGGLTGEVLAKLSNDDFDADWSPVTLDGGGA